MLKKVVLGTSIAILLGACATRPEGISASYVSHEKYGGADCLRLATQMSDARAELAKVSEMQNSKATGDAWGVFLLGVPFSQLSGDHAGDVAKWKGEVEAVETAQIKKNCKGNTDSAPLVTAVTPSTLQATSNEPVGQKLRELKNLRQEGVISEQDFKDKKQSLLEKL